ncbi:MAG: hypothetical protein J6Y88_02655, partial [Bacteroidales bacterium]|nr:hypothetical protein [Bacteroidales bacterium]
YYYSDCCMNFQFNDEVFKLSPNHYRRNADQVRAVCGELPILGTFEFSDFEAAYYYLSSGSGIEVLFVESADAYDLDSSYAPDCNWFVIQLPIEFINQELDLADTIVGNNWTMYCKWSGIASYYSTYDFDSGSLSLNIDEENGTVNFAINGVTVDRQAVNYSYSGSYIECSNYTFNWW